MGKYIFKRFAAMIPSFIGITILVYIISSLAGGSPLEMLLQDPHISAEEIARRRAEMGLDKPVIVQYLNWLGLLLKGNLGTSYRTYLPVTEMIGTAIAPTLILTLTSTLIALIFAVGLGVMAGYHPYSGWDYVSSALSYLGASMPNFFAALGLIYIFAVRLQWLPTSGMYDAFGERTWGMLGRHLILPALVLAIQQVGSLIRQTRGSMMEVLQNEYIRTARAQGISEFTVVSRYALRNALTTIVTTLGMQLPFIVGGAVVTEQIFSWPGLGSMMVRAINARDYPVIMGITVFISLAVFVGNFIIDLIYGILNPRIRY